MAAALSPSTGRHHRALEFASLAAVLTLLVACSSGATAPIASLTATEVAASPGPTVEVTAAPTPAPAPTAAIVKVTPIPGAPDSGLVVQLTAKTDLWSVSRLDAPPGVGWQIQINDADGGTHNFTVASGPTVPERIFMSTRFELVGSVTFDIPALPAGSYLFICTLHPERMTGTLTIGG